MKLSPTLTLALALAAGVAGAAVAQTSMTPNTSAANPQTTTAPTGSAYAQPTQAQPAPGATGQTAAQAPVQTNSNEQVRSAQQQLHAAGLYNGPIDGLMDPDTMAAIARFQQQHGLQQTSMLDQPTTDALNGSRTMGSGTGSPGAAQTTPAGAGEATAAPTTAQQPAR